MSGHSKWSQIKHKKALTDAKKSKIYAKLARAIFVAVREKGAKVETNPSLRAAIEKAKEANMPSDNIERAIKKASGGDKESLQEMLFEAYGPGGAAILISAITDNSNRTTNEIKHLLSVHGAKLAGPGSARFLFQKTEEGWQAQSLIPIDESTRRTLATLFEALDDHDDVQEIYSNVQFS